MADITMRKYCALLETLLVEKQFDFTAIIDVRVYKTSIFSAWDTSFIVSLP